MDPIILHPIIFYFLIGMEVLFMGVIFWIFFKWYKASKFDYAIFIDKSNRWSIVRDMLGNSSTYVYDKCKYILDDKVGLLNRKGKSLYIFSKGKPQGMKIEYNGAKWLSSESMMAVINNKLIQKLVQTQDSFIDKLLLFGAIGGMLAGIASTLILLKQFGVI